MPRTVAVPHLSTPCARESLMAKVSNRSSKLTSTGWIDASTFLLTSAMIVVTGKTWDNDVSCSRVSVQLICCCQVSGSERSLHRRIKRTSSFTEMVAGTQDCAESPQVNTQGHVHTHEEPSTPFNPSKGFYLAFLVLTVLAMMVSLDGTSVSVALPVSQVLRPDFGVDNRVNHVRSLPTPSIALPWRRSG